LSRHDPPGGQARRGAGENQEYHAGRACRSRLRPAPRRAPRGAVRFRY
jgi:hypothetical protein